MRKVVWSVALAWFVGAVCACSGGSEEKVIDDPIGKLIDFSPLPVPKVRDARLPESVQGRPILMATAGASLEYEQDLNDPLTALGDCANWILDCFSPPERGLDDCFRSAPRCATATPWTEEGQCCPLACYEQYAARRKGGEAAYSAFDTVLFVDSQCVPGAKEMVEVAQ